MTKPNKSSLLFMALITLLLTGLAVTSYAYAGEIPEGYEVTDSCSKISGSVSRQQMAQLADEHLFKMISQEKNGTQGEISLFATSPLNATDITIYALDDGMKMGALSDGIPSNIAQSFQLLVNGKVATSYKVISGKSVTVDAQGNIKPKYTTWYWNGGIGSTVPSGAAGETVENSANYGTSIVQATLNGSSYTATVTLENYATYYANKVMDDYLASNVNASMTTKEKCEKIAEFIAGYNYSVYYQSAAGMIISGGGDCWASSNTTVAMAKKLGLDSWSRNGNRDLGAGSGHMNAMVSDGTNYYEIEAGYSGTAPRAWNVTTRNSLFSYYYKNGNVEIYQYDGKPNSISSLTVPSEINGYPVVALSDSCFYRLTGVKTLTLPSTLKTIGKSAFNSMEDLTTLNIPASVTSIEELAFTNCGKLTGLTCNSANQNYKIVNGALLSKDGKTLLSAPAMSSYTIPGTVTAIADYAFYYNKNLKSVTIPASVTKIGIGAFGACSALTSVTIQGNGLKTIDQFAFRECYALKYVKIPSSVTSIESNAFQYHASDLYIDGDSGSYAASYAKSSGISFGKPPTKPSTSTQNPGNGNTPSTPSDAPGKTPLKVGTVLVSGNLQYRVTSIGSSGGKVQVTGSTKGKAKLSGTVIIPQASNRTD